MSVELGGTTIRLTNEYYLSGINPCVGQRHMAFRTTLSPELVKAWKIPTPRTATFPVFKPPPTTSRSVLPTHAAYADENCAHTASRT